MGEVASQLTPSAQEGVRQIERLVRLEIARQRASGTHVFQDYFHDLYLSDAQIDLIVAESPSPDPTAHNAQLCHARAELITIVLNVPDWPGLLARSDGLNPFEISCLLLWFALLADPRFERLFGYVQDDITQRWLRVELAIRMLADATVDARAHLRPTPRFAVITYGWSAEKPTSRPRCWPKRSRSIRGMRVTCSATTPSARLGRNTRPGPENGSLVLDICITVRRISFKVG